MQSFLAKCAALGIVAGGFTLTGDVGRLADRGRRLLDARTVPSETPVDSLGNDEPGPQSANSMPSPAVTRSPVAPPAIPPAMPPAARPQPLAADPSRLTPRELLVDAPVGRAFAVPAPPTAGPNGIDFQRMAVGSRLLVWVRRPGATGRARAMDLIAFDIIDPHSGAALEHRHAAMTHGSDATTVHAAPRRVVITRDADGRIAKGTMLRLAPLHGVNGLGPEEHIGTVLALDVQDR
jgi:hypothetical protein